MSAAGGSGLWLVVPQRFCGPPRSGNGGWTGGALAAHVPGDALGRPVTVTLRKPPPLDEAMAVERDGDATRLLRGETLVAEAVVPDDATGPAEVPGVTADEARDGETRFVGREAHPFDTCFVCGTAREHGDGLRIFPGEVSPAEDRPRVAGTWTPQPSHAGPPPEGGGPEDPTDVDGTVSLAVAWAALDCIGGWATGRLGEEALVLGRMTCAVDRLPRIGEQHVVVGTRVHTEGRRTDTAATLRDAEGRVVARATHTWIAVDPALFT